MLLYEMAVVIRRVLKPSFIHVFIRLFLDFIKSLIFIKNLHMTVSILTALFSVYSILYW